MSGICVSLPPEVGLDTVGAVCKYPVRSEIRNDVGSMYGLSGRDCSMSVESDQWVEEHKTSREPNGRTREEGSDRGHPPPRGRTSCGVALACLAPEHWARAACVV